MKMHPCYSCGCVNPQTKLDQGIYYFVECPECKAASYVCHDVESAERFWNDICEMRNHQLKKIEPQPTIVYVVIDLIPAVFSTIEKARERVYSLRPNLFAQLQSEHKFQLADSMIHTVQIQ